MQSTCPLSLRGTHDHHERRPKPVHPVDEVLPAPKLAIYGFQHVLAFYAGAVLVPIILANAPGSERRAADPPDQRRPVTCRIASIIQAAGIWKIGVRLPLLQGVTFTAVSPMIAIGLAAGGGTDGLLSIYGPVIVAGLFTLLIAPYFARLIRFFPSVVTGTVILILGIALLPVAAGDIVQSFGPQDMQGEPVYRQIDGEFVLKDAVALKDIGYALGTLILIVLIQRFFKGFMQTVAVLIGLVVGTLVAWAMGDAHFDAVASADVVGYTSPFFFGVPTFSITAILSMMIVMIITAVETTGDVFATGEIVDKKIGNEDISRALRADGVATTLGGVLNSFPYTCFTENVGLVRLTQIKSRWVVVSAGVIMIILGSLPKAAAIVAGIPHPVLGGAALVMFATVAVVGLQTLAKVDFNDYNIFQGPTWPVEKAFGQRPFADAPDLRAAFQEALLGGTAEEQRELMTAYPNLGVDRELTAESATDQSWVGLAYLGEEEEQEFAELSKIYHEKFGIPFIVCLRDLEKRDQILRLGWRRLENSFGQEHVAALNEVSRIAGYRFEDLVAGANPISSARTQRFEQLR